MRLEIQIGGRKRGLEIGAWAASAAAEQGGSSRRHLCAVLDGKPIEADVVEVAPGIYSILLGAESFEVRVEERGAGLVVHARGNLWTAKVADPRQWRRRGGTLEVEGRQQVVAPMPGKIVRVLVKAGDAVEAGQGLLVVEAMKMQNEIRSPKKGTVERLLVAEGQAVNAGDVLITVA
jgi:acetyl/propionyl-CoA carboxylase alpha subunit